jgi:peptidoglycan/xylan/chitin deacetylase (PgdA/CDA1 family)
MHTLLRRMRSKTAAVVRRGLSDSAFYSGLYRLAGRTYGGAGLIITLHRVAEPGQPNLYPGYRIDSNTLDSALQAVRRFGWEAVTLDEMARRLEQGEAKRRFVCFTFDDGYLDNLRVALPVFRKHQIPFSVNVTTGIIERSIFYWWGGLEDLVLRRESIEFQRPDASASETLVARTPAEKQRAYDILDGCCHRFGPGVARDLFARYGIDADGILERDAMTVPQLRELAADPLVTIGAHCITHERLARMEDGDSCFEIHESKRLLEQWLGREVRHLAYPFGKADACGPREFEFARRAGYRTAVTTRPGNIFPEHRDFLMCLPRRDVPQERISARNALFGVETYLRRQPRFQTA